jgi:NAD(P)-dependent dehydrogenase (short-subunit alcohol dehydrogenase family)
VRGQDPARLQAAVEDLRKLGRCTGVQARPVHHRGHRTLGRCNGRGAETDILVHNEGAWAVGPIDSPMAKSSWDEVFGLNVKALFFLAQRAADLPAALLEIVRLDSCGELVNVFTTTSL